MKELLFIINHNATFNSGKLHMLILLLIQCYDLGAEQYVLFYWDYYPFLFFSSQETEKKREKKNSNVEEIRLTITYNHYFKLLFSIILDL